MTAVTTQKNPLKIGSTENQVAFNVIREKVETLKEHQISSFMSNGLKVYMAQSNDSLVRLHVVNSTYGKNENFLNNKPAIFDFTPNDEITFPQGSHQKKSTLKTMALMALDQYYQEILTQEHKNESVDLSQIRFAA